MKYVSICGANCLLCGCYGNLCKGCNASGGAVFHTGNKPCAIYSCAQRSMNKNCCGCEKSPCEVWHNTRDPKFTDEQFSRNVELRIRTLSAIENRRIIFTPRMTLMPLKVSDAKDVFKWTGDAEVTRFMNYSTYQNERQVAEWLKTAEKSGIFGFFLNDGELIGCGDVSKNKEGEYELGYNLAKAYWGKGYCTEAAKGMLAYAAEELNVREFVCKHAKENVRSGRVIEKCGFDFVRESSYTCFDGERTFPDREYMLHVVKHDMNVDSEWFCKIAEGEKTVELRLNDEKRRDIKVGDYVTLHELIEQNQTGEKCVVRVTALHSYSDFAELYANLDMTKCGYGKNAVPNASDMLKYYSLKRQREYGVLGIEFELLALL